MYTQALSIQPSAVRSRTVNFGDDRSKPKKMPLQLPPLRRFLEKGCWTSVSGQTVPTGVSLKKEYGDHIALGLLQPDLVKSKQPPFDDIKTRQAVYTAKRLIVALQKHQWFRDWMHYTATKGVRSMGLYERDKSSKVVAILQSVDPKAFGADLKAVYQAIRDPKPSQAGSASTNTRQVAKVTGYVENYLPQLVQNLRILMQNLTPEQREKIMKLVDPERAKQLKPEQAILEALLGKETVFRFVVVAKNPSMIQNPAIREAVLALIKSKKDTDTAENATDWEERARKLGAKEIQLDIEEPVEWTDEALDLYLQKTGKQKIIDETPVTRLILAGENRMDKAKQALTASLELANAGVMNHADMGLAMLAAVTGTSARQLALEFQKAERAALAHKPPKLEAIVQKPETPQSSEPPSEGSK